MWIIKVDVVYETQYNTSYTLQSVWAITDEGQGQWLKDVFKSRVERRPQGGQWGRARSLEIAREVTASGEGDGELSDGTQIRGNAIWKGSSLFSI